MFGDVRQENPRLAKYYTLYKPNRIEHGGKSRAKISELRITIYSCRIVTPQSIYAHIARFFYNPLPLRTQNEIDKRLCKPPRLTIGDK